MNDIAKALVGAIAGGVIGWSGTALSMGGRVAAIEATLIRIEKRLDQFTTPTNERSHHGKEATQDPGP